MIKSWYVEIKIKLCTQRCNREKIHSLSFDVPGHFGLTTEDITSILSLTTPLHAKPL